MTFFRMKLDAEDILGMHRAAKFSSITGHGGYILRPFTLEVEGVQEIEAGIILQSREKPEIGRRADVVPSHMGKREVTRRIQSAQAAHATANPPESGPLAFFARSCEDLHADANAKHWHASL